MLCLTHINDAVGVAKDEVERAVNLNCPRGRLRCQFPGCPAGLLFQLVDTGMLFVTGLLSRKGEDGCHVDTAGWAS